MQHHMYGYLYCGVAELLVTAFNGFYKCLSLMHQDKSNQPEVEDASAVAGTNSPRNECSQRQIDISSCFQLLVTLAKIISNASIL